MGLSPGERTKVLAGLGRLFDLEQEVETIKAIINDFPDVRKARDEAKEQKKKDERKQLRDKEKAADKADQEKKVKAADDAKAKLKEAIKELEKAKKDAGIE